MGFSRKGVVLQDVMYDVQFMLLFFILQVIRVESVEQELDSGVFVVYGVV